MIIKTDNKKIYRGYIMENDNFYCYTDDLYARYIDGVLSRKEKINFEDHLLNCDSCLNIINKGFNDVYIFSNKNLLEVPKKLLQKARDFNYAEKAFFTVVIKKVKEKLSILNHNFHSAKLIPALKFKGKENVNSVILKEHDFDIQLEFENKLYNILIKHKNLDDYKSKLSDENGNLIGIINAVNSEAFFENIKIGIYHLSFADKNIRFELI